MNQHTRENTAPQATNASQTSTSSESIQSAQTNDAAVTIIGFGTAGVNALIALRTAGYHGSARVFSDTNILPYSPILTSEYAGGEKPYENCFPWSAAEIEALDAEIISNAPVVALDPKAHTISTAEETYPYTKCIITSGATPFSWRFANVEYEPFVLRSMDDAERLKDALTNPGCKRVLVSGASLVALKTVEACLHRGLEVTLVGMNPHVLDFNALPEAAIRFEKGLQKNGVELLLGQTMESVKLIEDSTHPLSRQLEVTFSTGEVQLFDEITIAHGMKCNLEFLPEGALESDRALLVDECMRTSDADIYAAGDIVQALELISGEKRIVGLWKNAAVQGACAGRVIAAELAGEDIPAEITYKGSIPTNTIAVMDTLFISAGTMELTPTRRVEISEDDEMTILYIYENVESGSERLVGFNLVCDKNEEGGKAYDTGAMLTLRIEKALKKSV